jgi:phosphoribosylformylglycinamidine synthase
MNDTLPVWRVYATKRTGFDVEAQGLCRDLRENVKLTGLVAVRVYNRYDVTGISEAEYRQAKNLVFAEPPVDDVFDETVNFDGASLVIAIEALPGQYDQRADSAAQCIQIITQKDRPTVCTARLIALYGNFSQDDSERIRQYLINPVECREASFEKPLTLANILEPPEPVKILHGFRQLNQEGLAVLLSDMGLAMSFADLLFCQRYFQSEDRDPTLTEIRVIDTYWSDHCRHTTFLTRINKVRFDQEHPFGKLLSQTYQTYLEHRIAIHGDRLAEKPACLMDLATMAMKVLRRDGYLADLDDSGEINACSIRVRIPVNDRNEDYLIMFKNETHNHPTEIEPFGGAATCLGGAIRDPLSGRTYVYQAMRVSGSGDPTVPIDQTMRGKLPQRKITMTAAAGYSAYGNQIGLATGQVDEVYHPGYMAKHMEIGAVIGAAPAANIRRETPEPGDVILLLGGRTGRDGCGGATGSSKVHTEASLTLCGSEVQKGNPPTERKIQRLFRDPAVSRLILRCNDFGAGGVSVAIGELADGLVIDLDRVSKKYEGLDRSHRNGWPLLFPPRTWRHSWLLPIVKIWKRSKLRPSSQSRA